MASVSGGAGAVVGETNIEGVTEAEAEAEAEGVVVVVIVVAAVVVEGATGDIDVPALVKEGDGAAIFLCYCLYPSVLSGVYVSGRESLWVSC